MLKFTEIDKPRIDIELYGTDTYIPPIDKVHVMDEDSFEQFTLEWLYGCKKTKYSSIRRVGGAGDKGRDIIAYYNDGAVDYYQCKHYNTALMPTDYYLELGKLCYYTYNKEIPIPKEYYIIVSKIADHDRQINESINENQKILSQLHTNNETLSECNVLLNRYNELTAQYASDLKRLSFIIDGELNYSDQSLVQCPFCDSKINVKKTHNYIDAAKSDYKRIKLQSKDLEKATQSLCEEKRGLEQEIKMLMKKKKLTEELIETELKPQLYNLKEKLSEYKIIIERKKEMDILKKISKQKTSDIIDNDSDDESVLSFKVKEHLDYSFINDLGNSILSFLEDCKYDNLLSVTFDKTSMDIVVNGKKKSSNGKGYNAYFNSVVAIALSRYMKEKAEYSPDFLVLDSPILSLKEKQSKKPSETMRNTLFENIISNQNGIQTIVIENEIPDIAYEGVNIIHFTKETDNGRYGFLMDVVE